MDTATKTNPSFAKALYSYESITEGDLSFKEDDIIRVEGLNTDDPSWWIGSLKDKSGLVPSNYLEACVGLFTSSSDLVLFPDINSYLWVI